MRVCLVYDENSTGEVFILGEGRIATEKDIKKAKRNGGLTYDGSIIYDKKKGLIPHARLAEEQIDKNALHRSIIRAISDPVIRNLESNPAEDGLKEQEYDQWLKNTRKKNGWR
jgi:hypothetical protein